MTITPQQIQLVRDGWTAVAPIQTQAAELFTAACSNATRR